MNQAISQVQKNLMNTGKRIIILLYSRSTFYNKRFFLLEFIYISYNFVLFCYLVSKSYVGRENTYLSASNNIPKSKTTSFGRLRPTNELHSMTEKFPELRFTNKSVLLALDVASKGYCHVLKTYTSMLSLLRKTTAIYIM